MTSFTSSIIVVRAWFAQTAILGINRQYSQQLPKVEHFVALNGEGADWLSYEAMIDAAQRDSRARNSRDRSASQSITPAARPRGRRA